MSVCEDYCRVIDLIDNGTINHRAISMTLAKLQPRAFLAIHDSMSESAPESPDSAVDHRALQIALGNILFENQSGKVPAIKYVRTKLGLGLKEAKDRVDGLLEHGIAPLPAAPKLDLAKLLDELLGAPATADASVTYPDGGTY